MLKKLTAILMSLMLVLSVTAVFAAEAPTLAQTETKTVNIEIKNFALIDKENPDLNITENTVQMIGINNSEVMLVKADLRGYADYGFIDSAVLDIEGGNVGSITLQAYNLDADWNADVTYNDMKTIIEPLLEKESDAAQTSYSTTHYRIDLASCIDENGQLNVMITNTRSSNANIYTSGTSTHKTRIEITNNVIAFKNQKSASYKLSTTEFAMTDGTSEEAAAITATLEKSGNLYEGKQWFVKADLSSYKKSGEIESAVLSIEGSKIGTSMIMYAYNLGDTSWDATNITYNSMKTVIEELTASDADATATVAGVSTYAIDLAEFVDEKGMLNVLITTNRKTSGKNSTFYGPAATAGPKINLTYYNTAEAITDATAMKIKASAASYEAGTAAVPFAALYDSTGALSEVIMGSVITSGGEVQSTEIEITADQATAASTIKVFMWADGTLVPLNDVVSQINK